MNDVEDVHQLALVLVYTFDLNVVERVERDIVASVVLNPLLEALFVLFFDFDKFVNKLAVLCLSAQLLESVKTSDPLVNATNSLTDEVGQSWVAAVDPPAWSYSVGLVLNLAWV